MKKILNTLAAATALLCTPFHFFAQTTAMDFQGVDCNGNNVHLFSDLDAGKAVILFYYMPNCGSCPPPAMQIQQMANRINSTHPGLVKAYAFPFQNTTTCSYSSSWVTDNNLTLYTPMDSGAVQVAYYGGFGMPTAVLVGGANHDVLFTTQDYSSADTTTIRDLILNNFTAGLTAQKAPESLKAFPNPANDMLEYSFNGTGAAVTIELVDLSGKIVLNKTAEASSKEVTGALTVSGIQSGNYLLRITSGNQVSQQEVHILH